MCVSIPKTTVYPWIVRIAGSLLFSKLDGGIDVSMVRRVAAHICSIKQPTVLIHGAGFGDKWFAAQQGVRSGEISSSRHEVVARYLVVLRRLHLAVHDTLVSEGLRVVPLSPMSLCNHLGQISCPTLLESLIAKGYIPLLHSDLIQSEDGAFTVVTGDGLATEVCRHFPGGRLLFAADEAGVSKRNTPLSSDDGLFPAMDAEMVRRLLERRSAGRLSGPMVLRLSAVNAALEHIDGCNIFDGRSAKAWQALVTGETCVGTYIRGDAWGRKLSKHLPVLCRYAES